MKRILLLSCTATVLYLSLTSSSNGPSLTGHATAALGCDNGGSCHGGASSATTATLILIEQSTGDTVKDGKYKPSEPYTVAVAGSNATATHYGFMLRASKNSAADQAGSFANPTPSMYTKTQPISPSPFTVFEHKAPVPAMSNALEATVQWTAPATGTGDVVMHLSVNAVNNNGNTSGDQWASTSTTFAEKPASVASVNKSDINIFPNPVSNTLYINANKNYQYTVVAINGSVELNGNSNQIDVTGLATGMHILRITDGQNVQIFTFNKL